MRIGSPVLAPVCTAPGKAPAPLPGIVRKIKHSSVPHNVLVVFPHHSEFDNKIIKTPDVGTYWCWFAADDLEDMSDEGKAA